MTVLSQTAAPASGLLLCCLTSTDHCLTSCFTYFISDFSPSLQLNSQQGKDFVLFLLYPQ